MDLMVFEGFQKLWGIKEGQRPKKFSFLIFGPILKILLSFES